jgi:hypothetical protein
VTDQPTSDAVLDPASERALGVALYNHVFTLLETPDGPPRRPTR